MSECRMSDERVLMSHVHRRVRAKTSFSPNFMPFVIRWDGGAFMGGGDMDEYTMNGAALAIEGGGGGGGGGVLDLLNEPFQGEQSAGAS